MQLRHEKETKCFAANFLKHTIWGANIQVGDFLLLIGLGLAQKRPANRAIISAWQTHRASATEAARIPRRDARPSICPPCGVMILFITSLGYILACKPFASHSIITNVKPIADANEELNGWWSRRVLGNTSVSFVQRLKNGIALNYLPAWVIA